MSASAGQTEGRQMRERFGRHLIGIAVFVAVVSLAHYFGWLSEAPPLLAPGLVP
jgi:hypothetical protein